MLGPSLKYDLRPSKLIESSFTVIIPENLSYEVFWKGHQSPTLLDSPSRFHSATILGS
jgi:hypothetical protein